MSTSSLDYLQRNLQRVLYQHNMNTSELASKAGVKPSFISDILHGKSLNPSAIKLHCVAQSIGLSLDDLFQPIAAQDGTPSAPLCSRHPVALAWLEETTATPHPSTSPLHFDRTWLEHQFPTLPLDTLRLCMVQDTTMQPTLRYGDLMIVSTTPHAHTLSGIYLLQHQQHRLLRAVELEQQAKKPHYHLRAHAAGIPPLSLPCSEVTLIARVLWHGGKLVNPA